MHAQELADTRHHAQHDLSLIAGLAADDLTATERARAEALLAGCTACRLLGDDLVAIARATRVLPAARAPRDFRITPDQAARLRRTGWLATLLAPFSGARSAAKPLATAFTTLGIAGVFVATVLPGMFGGMALNAAPEAGPTGAAGGGAGAPVMGPTATQAPAPQFGPAVSSGAPGAKDASTDNATASGDPGFVQPGGGETRDTGSNPGGRLDAPAARTNLLLLGSLALLAAGLAMFGLRFAGRRLRS